MQLLVYWSWHRPRWKPNAKHRVPWRPLRLSPFGWSPKSPRPNQNRFCKVVSRCLIWKGYLHVSGSVGALKQTWFMLLNLFGSSHIRYIESLTSKHFPKFGFFLTCMRRNIHVKSSWKWMLLTVLPSDIICESALPSAAIFLAISRSSPVDPLPHQM